MASVACPHCGETMELFPATDEARSIWTKVEKLVSLPIDSSLAAAADQGVIVDGAMSTVFDDLAARVISRLS